MEGLSGNMICYKAFNKLENLKFEKLQVSLKHDNFGLNSFSTGMFENISSLFSKLVLIPFTQGN